MPEAVVGQADQTRSVAGFNTDGRIVESKLRDQSRGKETQVCTRFFLTGDKKCCSVRRAAHPSSGRVGRPALAATTNKKEMPKRPRHQHRTEKTGVSDQTIPCGVLTRCWSQNLSLGDFSMLNVEDYVDSTSVNLLRLSQRWDV